MDFIALLSKLDKGYPPHIRIRLLLDNHSAHISKQTHSWLRLHPNRFDFVFTPKHGSWLNLVETMFSKMARSMLRGTGVESKPELIDRIHLYFDPINADPVVFRWKYKMDRTKYRLAFNRTMIYPFKYQGTLTITMRWFPRSTSSAFRTAARWLWSG